MSAAVSSLPIFSANNPLAVAPAPSPEAPHPNAFSQMLKQRQQAQAPAPAPVAAAPVPARAPATQPARPPAVAAPKAPPSQAAARPEHAPAAQKSADAKTEAPSDTPGAEAPADEAGDTAAAPDASLGSWLAGLNLPALQDTQAGGHLGRGQAQPADGPADPAAGTEAGEAKGAGGRRLQAGLEATGARGADRQAGVAQGADAPAAKLLADAAAQEPSFREVAAKLHGPSDSVRTEAAPVSGALLASGLAAAAPSTPAEAPAVVNLPTPVDSPDFAQSLGVQVSVLATDGVQQAELHLNPPEMGPISVQIAIDGTQAQVDFGADMASTRQVIESGLPELASALRDAGFTLTGGGVSQQARQGSQDGGQGRGEGGSRSRAIGGVEAGEAAPRRATTRVSAGGVDLYA